MFAGIGRKAIFCVMVFYGGLALAQVKINEFMYAPSGGAPEWIELYNTSHDSVNIKDWKVRNKNAKLYTLTTSDFYILPEAYLVITKSDTIFTFHKLIPSRVIICPALPAAFMVNTGDTISIHDSAGMLIDSVFYQPSWGGSGGKSLERISADDSPFLSTNWGTSLDTSGSSPGRKNSIAARQNDLKITSFSASLLPTESICIFKLTVENSGRQTARNYTVKVFLDYNSDHVPQLNELVALLNSPPVLAAGDSAQFALESTLTSSRRVDALAEVNFDADEDTTNNFQWTKPNISYPEKSVVVNEIMYAPVNPAPEWVELFNESQDSVDLCGFTISDNSNTETVITNQSRILPPGEYIMVADDSNFVSLHPLLRDNVLVTKIPSLNNSGDAVVIHDASTCLIDSVNYSASWGGNTGGKSLERILPNGGSNDPQNFETCVDSSGSTPGGMNSVTPRGYDLAVGNIISFPLSIRSGESSTVSVNIVNVGTKPAESSTVILFNDINIDGVSEANEIIDSTQIGMLSATDSATVRFNTGTLTYGTYHLGILVKFSGDERPANNIGAIILNVGLPSESIIINEIMYAPKAPESEWIELYNTSNSTVDLSDFKLDTHGGSSKILIGSLLAPHDFAVLCRDSSASRFHYPVKNLIIQSIPSLSNGGDGLGLHDNIGNLLDTISYEPSYGGSNGKSLERIDYLAGSDSTNWQESADTTGATPGAMNSVAILPDDIAVKRIDSPSTALTISEPRNIGVVIRNVGRNPASDVTVSIRISKCIDENIVFSDAQVVSRSLPPKDSAAANFVFTPSQPGAYRVLASVSHQSDGRPRNDTLSALLNVCYRAQTVVVNEIMYTNGPMGEYFEIFNASQNPIDLHDWTYHTSAQSRPIHSSTAPALLLPNQYLLIAADSSILDFMPDTNHLYLSKSLTLRDDGDCIALMDPSGAVVDSVFYLPSWHNSDIARTSGRSLEKINPMLPSNDKTSWSTSVSQVGGTPGERNSLFVNAGNATGEISVEPNPFSPDGDGHNDFTFINYSFSVSSVKIRIRIFDSIGRLIATPADNMVLPSTGRLVWDGRGNSGRIVKFGLYILFVEVTGPDAKSLSTYKRPLVVAKKMK